MARVELQASGSVETVTRLIDLARERGFVVVLEDEAGLATGSGRMAIEPPNIDKQAVARAAVQALINEVPGGPATFTLV